jgi:hypothetical protein
MPHRQTKPPVIYWTPKKSGEIKEKPTIRKEKPKIRKEKLKIRKGKC